MHFDYYLLRKDVISTGIEVRCWLLSLLSSVLFHGSGGKHGGVHEFERQADWVQVPTFPFSYCVNVDKLFNFYFSFM